MTETPQEIRYKLLELCTNGWNLVDKNSENLTKAQCDEWIERALDGGISQDRLKVARQDDPRYPEHPVQ
tara:strand:+ start:160 stop:366 length:207 start_codon:yes stop_codon:yes gene_type:complete